MQLYKRLLLLLPCLLLIGCDKSDNPATTSFYGEAMTVPYRILVGKNLDITEQTRVNKIIGGVFEEVNHTYNKWNPHSELSRLNQAKAYQKIELSKPLDVFLRETDKLVLLTEGKFDPTIEAIQKVLKQHLQEDRIPSELELHNVSQAVGWNKIHLSGSYFWKDHDLLEIDLGGIAKGFAIDLLVVRLNAAGFPNVFVEWGGEIRTSGSHPEKRPWRVFVSHMGDPNPASALAIVDMEDNAIASSGDYLQNWTIDDVTYFHIINPQTCKPLIATNKSICSATILAPNCMLADLLATTAMLFDTRQEAEKWLQHMHLQIPAIRYWIATREDGRVEKKMH